MKPTILTCSVTGTFSTREMNPALPVTPAEIADSCIGAAKAGAAICHIHVRDPQTGRQSMKLDHYREVVQRIRASDVDMIINLSTGPGSRFIPCDDDPSKAAPGSLCKTADDRTEHILALKPEICSLDMNTMWFGGGAVINSPRMLRRMAQRIYEAGAKPEIEVFDTGDLVMAQELLADETLKMPLLFQIVTGIKYGMPSTPEALLLAKSMLPENCEWASFGPGRYAFPMLAQAFLLGGHCRIGMEDTVHIEKGVLTPDNATLVAKAVRIIRELDGKVATPAEARSLLGLPGPR
jgi:uncharacterized protein (DUF849 family)